MNTTYMVPVPENEFERLVCLSAFDIDPTEQQDHFADLTALAATVAGTKYATINVLSLHTQWTIAASGLPTGQINRDETICQFAICNTQPLEIMDLQTDPLYRQLRFVQENPQLKYYLGIPLTSNDMNLGVLCLLDEKNVFVSPRKVEVLQMIAALVVQRLEQVQEKEELKAEAGRSRMHLLKMAHDIRSPLSGMVGLSNFLQVDPHVMVNSQTNEMINTLHNGLQSLLALTNELVAEVNVSGHSGYSANISLGALGELVKKLYLPQAASKDITLELEISNGKKDVQVLRSKLLQVAGNLVSNAIKFTPVGGFVNIEFDMLYSEKGAELEMIVADSGIGMDTEAAANIENGTMRNSVPGTAGENGSGLGLQLVRMLLEELNGTLSVSSTEGFGSTFRVLVPVR